MIRSKTVIATPPGATIKEQLNDRQMSQKEFAWRMDMSQKHISKLINGEVQLTPDVAMRLEMVLGIPANFWSKLEMIYREKIIKAELENQMEEDFEIVKKMPYHQMAKNGWVENTRKANERVYHLRQFFEVVSLSKLDQPLIPGIACRKLGGSEKSDYALMAWVQKAKLNARHISVEEIHLKKLKEILPSIKEMTTQEPQEFVEKLCQQLASCGIALVFLPHMEGSFLQGATFYDGAKIVMGMTVRGKDADKFWFSLFHELGHLVLGHVKQKAGISEEDEKAADLFAKDVLIDRQVFEQFIDKKDFRKETLLSFAEEVGVDVGIVVGRLQKENHIEFNQYNDLKTKYELIG